MESRFLSMCTIQHSWFYPDFCAKHLGELSSLIVVFGPCRALREEGTLSKMFVQFNILDIICAKHLGEFLGSWIVDLSGAQLSGAQLSVF